MGSKSKYLICRLCLSYGEVLVDICEGEAEPGFEVKETIEDLLRVEVVGGGDLPWLICLNCIAKLEDFSNFKFKCISSNSAFVQRFTKPRQSVRPQVTTESMGGCSRAGGGEARVCGADSSRRVVLGMAGGRSCAHGDNSGSTVHHSDRRGVADVCTVGRKVASQGCQPTPVEAVNKGTTTYVSLKPPPVAIADRLPSSIKAEEEGEVLLVPGGSAPLRQMGSGIVIVSTTSGAVSSSSERKALCFKANDPRDVVQSEMLDEQEDDEDEGEDRKEGILMGSDFDHESSVGGRTTTGFSSNLCPPPHPANRLLVYPGGVEGGGGEKRMMGQEDSVEQRELRLDKVSPGGEMGSRGDLVAEPGLVAAIALRGETPLERKRRMARERQRRFRARQSTEMAWRRAQDGGPFCKRQWVAYEQPAPLPGDEEKEENGKLAYQRKL